MRPNVTFPILLFALLLLFTGVSYTDFYKVKQDYQDKEGKEDERYLPKQTKKGKKWLPTNINNLDYMKYVKYNTGGKY